LISGGREYRCTESANNTKMDNFFKPKTEKRCNNKNMINSEVK
jgi:hypothetical protein